MFGPPPPSPIFDVVDDYYRCQWWCIYFLFFSFFPFDLDIHLYHDDDDTLIVKTLIDCIVICHFKWFKFSKKKKILFFSLVIYLSINLFSLSLALSHSIYLPNSYLKLPIDSTIFLNQNFLSMVLFILPISRFAFDDDDDDQYLSSSLLYK